MASQNKATPDEFDLPHWSWWGIISSAIAAQMCCGLPWLLVSLGLGGGYISYLEALRPYRPYFVLMALLFLLAGIGMYMYRRKTGCPLPKS